MWRQPWGYAEGWAICLGLLVTGAGLQWVMGPVEAGLFRYPLNCIVGLLLILFLGLVSILGRRTSLVTWLSGLTASLTALASLLAVVLVTGFTGPGSVRITTSCPFVLLFFYVLVLLGFIVLKKGRTLFAKSMRPFWKKDAPFFLNHAGLFLTLSAAILGSGDLCRLRMTVPLDQPEWRATDEQGKKVELPLAIELRSFTIDEYPPKLMLVDNTDGKTLPAERPQNLLVERLPFSGDLLDWKIEVVRSLPMAACVMGKDTVNFVEFHSEGATTALYVKASSRTGDTVKEGWVSCGSYIFPYVSLQLDEKASLVMPGREPKRFASDVVVYMRDKQTKEACVEVNKPLSIGGWKIYQLSYDESKGRWSPYSVFELVRDPWLPLVYTGIWMMIAGAIGLFVFVPTKNE